MSQKIDLLSPEFQDNPYLFYARLRNEPVLQQLEPGGLWAVTRPEDVQFVFKNPKLFSSAMIQHTQNPPWLAPVGNPLAESMVAMDPPDHTRLRALVTHAFTPKTIGRLEQSIRRVAAELAEDIRTRQEVDFIQAFAMPLPAYVIGELLGFAPELRPRLKQWSDEIVSITAQVQETEERMTYLRRSLGELREYLREVIEDRRRHPRNDMMSELVRVEVEGKQLTGQELEAFGALLMVGGLETTVHLLGHTAMKLAAMPELMARVRAEPALIPKLVEEVLRLEPSVHLTVRLTTTEVELGGVKLPPFSPVAAMMGAANRDPSLYERPDELDLDRKDAGHVSFGYGVHFCLGAPLARLEARVGLEELLSRCRGFVLAGDKVKWTRSIGIRGPTMLPLRAIPA